jgi:uncharacterized metal-binding protein
MAKRIVIEEPPFSCPLAEKYVEKHTTTPPKIPVVCCEGACLRGEIARRAANLITYKLLPKDTVRICFQGIVAGGCREGALIERAEKVLFLEGCALRYSFRLTSSALLLKADTDVVIADKLCDFDTNLFGIDEAEDREIEVCAERVAKKITETLKR